MAKLDKIGRKTAKKLINDFGKSISIKKMANGASVAQYPIKSVIDVFKKDEIDGTLIKKTDTKLLLAELDIEALNIEITTNDRVIIENKIYKIESNEPTYSGDLIAMETLQVRK